MIRKKNSLQVFLHIKITLKYTQVKIGKFWITEYALIAEVVVMAFLTTYLCKSEMWKCLS